MTTTIVFDVNETLLDLAAMDPIFERHFGDASVRREWFAQVLMTTLTLTLVGDYSNFAKVGDAALAMVGERRGVSTSRDQRAEIMLEMRKLPPHADVPTGLRTLRDNGFRLATLTNSPPAMVEEQLKHADLWLVAAHNWDTTGALAAGWRAAFLARPGMVIGPLDREPTLRGATLPEIAGGIVAAA
jgi:2-haloacid dehalogenase